MNMKPPIAVAALFLVVSCGIGCNRHYENLTHDPRYALLIGGRYVVSNAVALPEDSPHWLPETVRPDTPFPAQIVMEPGTILQVNHVERWMNLFDGDGTNVYAVAEGGKQRGRQFIIGRAFFPRSGVEVWFYNPEVGLKTDVGDSIRPVAPK